MTKIVSWNVNSIRVRLDHLSILIKENNPDIILLQETKTTNEDFPYEDIKDQGMKLIILVKNLIMELLFYLRYLLN